MTVRGGKNRVLAFVGAGIFLLALVLFYHNAATKLDSLRTEYAKCHMNEESLAAQLQVILEYKIRLEKSLAQEKKDHLDTKEDLKNKAQEERDLKDRENFQLNTKYTALQQQYKLLQSHQEDVTQELEKSKREQLTLEDDKSHLETQLASLTQQVKLLKEGRESDNILLKNKIARLESDYDKLKADGGSLHLLRERADLQRELSECLLNQTKTTPSASKNVVVPVAMPAPMKRMARSSTAANRIIDVAAGGLISYNTSTPVIDPLAVQSQDRLASPAPLPVAIEKIPALPEYKEQQEQHPIPEPEQRQPPQIPLPVERGVNEIPRNNAIYNYQAEYDKDGRKEEDDDDVDQIDYPNPNEKPLKPPVQAANVLIADKHDSVMVNPK